MRRKKHRGRSKPIDSPMSIEKIENRFNQQMDEKQLLAEAFLLGRNKYGNADIVPRMATK
jgi:hypothetical protein